jgi:hypothetical protein
MADDAGRAVSTGDAARLSILKARESADRPATWSRRSQRVNDGAATLPGNAAQQ